MALRNSIGAPIRATFSSIQPSPIRGRLIILKPSSRPSISGNLLKASQGEEFLMTDRRSEVFRDAAWADETKPLHQTIMISGRSGSLACKMAN